jgi:hypothetical protein
MIILREVLILLDSSEETVNADIKLSIINIKICSLFCDKTSTLERGYSSKGNKTVSNTTIRLAKKIYIKYFQNSVI